MGIFLIVLGTIALFSPFISTLSSVILFGILLTASGISHLVHAFWSPEWKGFFGQIILGILAAVIGWLLVMNPMLGAKSLTLLLAAFFIASGLFRIVSSLIYQGEYWGWLLANGILSVILGVPRLCPMACSIIMDYWYVHRYRSYFYRMVKCHAGTLCPQTMYHTQRSTYKLIVLGALLHPSISIIHSKSPRIAYSSAPIALKNYICILSNNNCTYNVN